MKINEEGAHFSSSQDEYSHIGVLLSDGSILVKHFDLLTHAFLVDMLEDILDEI